DTASSLPPSAPRILSTVRPLLRTRSRAFASVPAAGSPQHAGSSKSTSPFRSSSMQFPHISRGTGADAGHCVRSTLRQSAAHVTVTPAHVCPPTSAPSQTSPHSPSITPLPHSISPSALQPSQSAVLPSSHSSPQSTTPLPTTSRVQAVEHPSQSLVLPSSHCSPASSTPSPQRDDDPGRVVVVEVQGPDVKAAQALQSRKDPPGELQRTSPSQTSPGSTIPSPQRADGGSVVLVVVVLVRGVPAGSETMLRRSRMLAATRRPSTSTLLPRRKLANGAQTCA